MTSAAASPPPELQSAGKDSSQSAAAANALSAAERARTACDAVVVRVGEIFVELGFVSRVTEDIIKWNLTIKDDGNDIIFNEVLQQPHKRSKVVKLRPSKSYTFTVRMYDSVLDKWGPSSSGRFRMYSEVVTKCTAIGEDNVVIRWDRPPRPMEVNHTPERDPDLSACVRSMEGYSLKILRNEDMQVEFHQEFEPGVRTYTVYGLTPATRYVVLVSWKTLLGQQRQWQESLRFETQSAYELYARHIGEDFLMIDWSRAACPQDSDPDSAYQKSTLQPLQFEIIVEGGGNNLLTESVELQSSETSHLLQGLLAKTTYSIRLRAMSTRARWGVLCEPLIITTRSKPCAETSLVGEHFAKFTWGRKDKSDDTDDTCYRINVLGVGHKYNLDKTVDMPQVRADNYELLISDVSPGLTYKTFVKACCKDTWGPWSEGTEFTTRARPTVSCMERGEDFLTVVWGKQLLTTETNSSIEDDKPQQYQLLVTETETENTILETTYEGSSSGYRIPKLTPETQYTIKIRTVQDLGSLGDCYGLWSDPVVMTTLRPVALQLLDIGEDFVQLSWRRALQTSVALADEPGSLPKSGSWYDLKYEIILGCVESGEDNILHKELLETSYRVSQLAPNTTYSVAVRACDEREQWGLWCNIFFRTLSSVVLRCHEVGEDFARVVWEREATGAASTRLDNVLGADSFVSRFHLLLYSNDDFEGQLPPPQDNSDSDDPPASTTREDLLPLLNNATYVFDRMLNPSHTSYRIPDLVSDKQYAVMVRASTKTGIWGLWSAPVKFCTVAPFVVPVSDLSIGENYVHFTWGRDDHPVLVEGIQKGDYSVTSQQLRIRGLDDSYALDRTLPATDRDLKVYGLKPATAYSIQMRCCNTSGEWGTWSCDVRFQTRATIVMRTLEISENYIVVKWERKKSDERNRGYPSGRGYITRYHLRVTGEDNFTFDAELVESNSPYHISNLRPDKRYRVVIKANYNDDEWGLWSRPLGCLTLKLIDVKTLLIGEEFANIKWSRPEQSRELIPTGEGEEELIICFGQRRPIYQLRVTTPDLSGPLTQGQLSWAGMGVVTLDDTGEEKRDDSESEMRIVIEAEVSDNAAEVPFTVANMKPDTHYCLAVRSRIDGGPWGVWSTIQKLITLKPNVVSFLAIGEDFARIIWERPIQHVVDSKIAKGRGVITRSQVKVKSPAGQVVTYDIDTPSTTLAIEDYRPATTYWVSVRTYNDNHDWGLWSPDKAFKTVAGLTIDVESIGEDFLWISWAREASQSQEEPSVNSVVSVDTSVLRYQIRCQGDDGFSFTKEVPGDVRRCLALQGIAPNQIYEIAVRAFSRCDVWGQWSRLHFQTLNRLQISFGNIGEQFAVLKWIRPTKNAGVTGIANVTLPDTTVLKYRLRIAEVGNPHSVRLFDLPPSCTEFKVPDLTSNSEYSVWIAACNKNEAWGLWSPEARLHTLPSLHLTIEDLGEAYASVEWGRDGLSDPVAQSNQIAGDDGPITAYISQSDVSEYHVKVEGRQGIVVERHLSPDVTGCKVEGLEVDTVYRVVVRMKDAEGEWGLWSPVRRFITLRPVELTIQKVGENFVHLEWGRRRERKKDLDQLGFVTTAGTEEEEEEEAEEDEEEEVEEDEDEKSNPGDQKTEVATPQSQRYDDEDLDDVAVGSEEVQRWIVRVHGNKVGWSDNHSEFELPADELAKRIADLEPNTCYSISVRALSTSGQWGFWSELQTVYTLPLIKTNVSYIGEDFIVVTWNRPKNNLMAPHLGVFPPENAVHNYQLKITPLVDEKPRKKQHDPDKEEKGDADLASAERDFHVSQPKYEVWDMHPGTQYRVDVREKDIESNWGMWCERKTVQTLDPIGLKLIDLGECFSLVSWERVPTKRTGPVDLELVKSEADSTLYQVAVNKIEIDQKTGQSRTNDSFHLLRSFKKGETEWNITDLQPNKFYSIKVRCQTDGEYWGGWSVPLKYVTMKLLSVSIEMINEDNVILSWNRETVDWLMNTESPSEQSSQAEDNDDDRSDKESELRTGNYDVVEYQLLVEGLCNDASFDMTLSSVVSSYRMTGLQPDKLYSVSVRSKNTFQVWSMWSEKVSLLTLNPITIDISKVTESFIWCSWGREPQNLIKYEIILNRMSEKREQELLRVEEEREKEKQLRELEVGDQEVEDDDHEQSYRRQEVEQNLSSEAHLQIDNLNVASRHCTAYRLRIWGESGHPLPAPTDLCLPPDDPFLQAAEEERRKREQKVAAARTRRDQKKGAKGDTAAAPGKKVRRKAKTKGEAKDQEVDQTVEDDLLITDEVELIEEIDDDADHCLLDLQLRQKVNSFKVQSLHADVLYTLSVRARNAEGDWGLWSPKKETETLAPLQLCNSRFGEHYINLYWYRPSKNELLLEQQQDKLRREYEEIRKQQEEKERLEREQSESTGGTWVKSESSPTGKEKAKRELKANKQRVREQRERSEQRKEGRGEVYVREGTTITSYFLRVISEDGTIEDRVLPATDDSGATLNLYTVANLTPNHMYVVRLALSYGTEWGEWSTPTKFMTQNLLQLSISYVGESFIQLDWKRAPNKRLKGEDMSSVLTTPTEQGLGHHYQISMFYEMENKNNGLIEEKKQSVDVVDTNSFRITGMVSDMKYTLAVREWDRKGDWGLWSPQRCCMTLSRMVAAVKDIGENWIEVAWERMTPRIKYDDPSMVSIPVSVTAYYLNVEELDDNDLPEDVERRRLREAAAAKRAAEEAEEAEKERQLKKKDNSDTDTDSQEDEEDQMAAHRRRQRRKEVEDRQRLAELEAAVAESEKGVTGSDGRYRMTRKLDPTVSSLVIENLKSDRFCNIRVQAETSGNELGVWSPDCLFVTMRRIHVDVELVGEDNFTVSWSRQHNRKHPRLDYVHEGDTSVEQYEAEIQGRGSESHFRQQKLFTPSETSWKIISLQMNQVYAFSVRSRDPKDRWSLYSLPMEIVTLTQMRVFPIKTTEQLMVVQWGRDVQKQEQYPQRTKNVHFVISQERTMQYHLKVWNSDDRKATLVDKTFIGSLSRYVINYLTPNTTYFIESRACNAAGEWGAWSKQAEVNTMKLLNIEIDAVGESYIKTRWWRHLPDQAKKAVGYVADEDRERAAVYVSPETDIDKYEVTISVLGSQEGWEWSTDVTNDDDTQTYTITDLLPDKRYQVTIRASYKDDDWGTPSPSVATATLNVVTVEAVQAGENYLTAQWHRLDHTYQPQWGDAELHLGRLEKTLRWEYRITNVTQEDKEVVVAEDFTDQTSMTFDDLEPNQIHRVEVRHWYKPISYKKRQQTDNKSDQIEELDTETPQTTGLQPPEDSGSENETESCPGIWGEATHVATLKPMVATIDEIAEDFFSLRWERDTNALMFPPSSVAALSPEIQGYHVTIDQLEVSGKNKDMSDGTVHIDHEFGPDETAFRVTNLVPATAYRVMVRACTDGRWGLWSAPCVLITLPKLSITINNIGEDYVVLSWDRVQKQLKDIQALVGSSANVSRYHLEMYGVEQPFHSDKKFKSTRTTYKVKRLEVNSVYTVRVRSCDANNVWSLWSDQGCFVTLKPITVSFGKVAEQFINIHWSREPQLLEEYTHKPSPAIPEATVTKYHLCVFAAEHAPSAPLVDKQFSGEVTSFKVTSLNPNSMYIVIVRAANSELQWGSWSEERTALTLPLLNVKLDSIGENYITVGWGREEPPQAGLQSGVVVPSTEWHVVVTSHDLQYEKQVSLEELSKTEGLFTVRLLKPDTKYILTLRACYGNDEWGLWTNPVTFLTLNQLGLTVSNISEDRADFTWGRGVQSAQHTYDPNLVVWKGAITKYSLVIKKITQTVIHQEEAPEGGLEDIDNEVCIERDMEMNRYKYIQTYCTTDDLCVNTEYSVCVRAQDDKSEWGEWTDLIFETPPLPPGKPVLKKAHSNYIAFDWEPPDVYTRYLYCVEQAVSKSDRSLKKEERGQVPSTEGALEWKVVDTVSETYAKIKTTTALTKCRFRVKCCKMDKPVHLWSKYSPVAAFTTAVPPDAVLNLCITSLSKSSATLEWAKPTIQSQNSAQNTTSSSQVAKIQQQQKVTYKVLLGEKEGPVQLIGTSKVCRYELTSLKSNTHYRVQVQVETESGSSARNTILKFSTRADVGGGRNRSDSDFTIQTSPSRERMSLSAPVPGVGVGSDHPQSSESSDTIGNKVRLPALSPPKTAPTQPELASTHPVLAHPPSQGPVSSPAPRPKQSPSGKPPTKQGVMRPSQPPGPIPALKRPGSSGDFFESKLETLPDLAGSSPSVTHTGGENASLHSDEEYDVLSFQHSEETEKDDEEL